MSNLKFVYNSGICCHSDGFVYYIRLIYLIWLSIFYFRLIIHFITFQVGVSKMVQYEQLSSDAQNKLNNIFKQNEIVTGKDTIVNSKAVVTIVLFNSN